MATATVFRVNKASDTFTRISNKIFRDRRLSNKTLGLLCKILSLPEDWDYSIHGLVAICKEGERSVKDSLNELKECGYLTVEKTHNEKGHYRYIYTIYEEPDCISTRGTKPHGGYDSVVMRHNKLLNINDLNINSNVQNKKYGTFDELIGEKSTRFFKPTAEEVESYAKEIEYNLNGQSFVDYYESKGWMIGKSKMKDWKAAVRTWKRNDFKCNQKNDSSSLSSSAKPQDNYVHYEEITHDTDNIFEEKGITEKEFWDKVEQWKISVYEKTGEFINGDPPAEIALKILNKEI